MPTRLPAGPALERLLESAEQGMYEPFFLDLPPRLARTFGIETVRSGPSLRLTVRTFDHPMFNRVMGAGLPDPEDGSPQDPGGMLDQVADHYRSAGIRRWLVQVLPQAETRAFRDAAEARGLVRHRGWAKHVGPVPEHAPPFESDLQVGRLGDAGLEDVGLPEAWARVVAEGFGIPGALEPWLATLAEREGWNLYLALDGDVPAAAAGLFLSTIGDLRFAQLNFAATLPDFRRRGAQSALIARRLSDAARLGADWVHSETDEELPDRPNPSYHNLVRMGVPVVYVRANWGPPKPHG